MSRKQVLGEPIVINGRTLSLSKAIRAGDFIFLTGQIPMKDGKVVTEGTIEDQTIIVLDEIKNTLKLAHCELTDVVKSMIWLRDKEDFPGVNSVYGKYFPTEPPTRSAVINELLIDVRIEIEVVAYKPLK